MNQEYIMLKLRVLRAQHESIANTLTVLEKELADGGASANSYKKDQVRQKVAKQLARRDAQRRTKKPR
jgi:hypothetical protein